MAIRDYEAWAKSLSNFAWLEKVVPGACDGDCIIHAAGPTGDYFLFFEFKALGERMPLGQKILLDALRRQPNTTVVTVWGPDREGLYTLGGSWDGKVDQGSLTTMVKTWWNCAKAGGPA